MSNVKKDQKVICFCGSDSVGKSTQCKLLKEFLEQSGNKVEIVKSPYPDGITFNLIYKMLYSGFAVKYPTLFQCVQYINKCGFQFFFKKKFQDCDYIILDRWKLSMLVYGNSSGANTTVTKFFYDTLFTPDLAILLIGDAFKRRKKDDSYERNTILQNTVKREYILWSKLTQDANLVINPEIGREDVHGRVIMALIDNDLF